MAKNRPRLEQHLQRVADFIRSRNQRISLTVHRSRRLKGMQRRFGHIFLEGPESHAFQEILDLLSPDDGLATKHSRTVVDKWLQECVLAALLDKSSAEWVLVALLDKSIAKSLDERIGCAVKELRSRLQSPLLNWKVWQLVECLKISKQGFRFGKAFFSHPENDSAMNELQAFTEHYWSVKKRKLTPSRLWPADASKHVLCCIEVEAGDATAAMRVAEAELTATLGVLNFFASGRVGWMGCPMVAVQRSACPYVIERLAFTGGPQPAFQKETHFYRPIFGCFDPDWLKRSPSVQGAFQRADGFLKDEGEEKLRERFLTAMKWAGKGSATVDREDSFLFFALALEALILGEKKRERLTHSLASRVAHLLGSTELEKSKIQGYVKHLYGLRSSLVHTGKAGIPDSDWEWLKTLTTQSILKLMTGEASSDISTDDALENWFEDALMSSPNN